MLSTTTYAEAITELAHIKTRCDNLNSSKSLKLIEECDRLITSIRNGANIDETELFSSIEIMMDKLNYIVETNSWI